MKCSLLKKEICLCIGLCLTLSVVAQTKGERYRAEIDSALSLTDLCIGDWELQ